jgi:hypothetical protein
MRILITGIFAILFCLQIAAADVVTLSSGRGIECVVLQKTGDEVLVRMKYGTLTIAMSQVVKIAIMPIPGIETKAARERAAVRATTNPALLETRLPIWADCVDDLARRPWANGLIQIPATVVDNGVERFVPYLSHKCGTAYEMNVYGDPDFPACVEIGIRGDLLASKAAKQNCIEFIAAIMPRPFDAKAVQHIGIEKAQVETDGLTIEITPPTDPDAYGGWWVSVYDTKLMDKSRASDKEMQFIATSKASIEKAKKARAATQPADPNDPTGLVPDDSAGWTPEDVNNSRGGSDGGDVYVHGYYKANGTYVSPYTRSSPGSGGGRGGGHR